MESPSMTVRGVVNVLGNRPVLGKCRQCLPNLESGSSAGRIISSCWISRILTSATFYPPSREEQRQKLIDWAEEVEG